MRACVRACMCAVPRDCQIPKGYAQFNYRYSRQDAR